MVYTIECFYDRCVVLYFNSEIESHNKTIFISTMELFHHNHDFLPLLPTIMKQGMIILIFLILILLTYYY